MARTRSQSRRPGNTCSWLFSAAYQGGVFVCGEGAGGRDSIDISKPWVLREAVLGIIIHENGSNPYKTEVIDEGVRRALA